MANSPHDAKDRLERIAQGLKELSFPTSPIKLDDAGWLAKGIEAYLAEDGKSLDAALGLTLSRGGQPKQRKKELICQEWASYKGKQTFVEIATRLHEKYPETFPVEPDKKEISRAIGSLNDVTMWTPEARAAIAEAITNRLAVKDQK
jgi:hypothetical protein